MKIVSVILARGGSKGIPNKNIMLLKDKPLIQYSIDASLSSKTTILALLGIWGIEGGT